MKELSKEEKAKAYDRVSKEVKDFFEGKQKMYSDVEQTLEYLFPELKESEDEKIVNAIRKALESKIEDLGNGVTRTACLAWLEKQGEQKLQIEKLPEETKTVSESLGFTTQEECDEYNQMVSDLIMSDDDKDKLKFKVGDWVVRGKLVTQITSIENDGYTNSDQGFISFETAKKFHLWTIQDAKDGDVLVTCFEEDNIIIMYHSRCTIDTINVHCCLDNKFVCENLGVFDAEDVKPATKEQRDLLFQKMKEAGYEWDAEKKELRKIELTDVDHKYYSELLKNDKSDNIADYAYQCVYCMSHDWAIKNPTWDNVQSACRLGAKWQKKHDVSEEWSEEDEKMIDRIRGIVEAHAFSQSAVDVNGGLCEKEYIEADNWLNSLKERIGE